MRRIELLLQDNVRGSDPVDHLYKAVNLTYPEIGLTRVNSKVIKIQPYPQPDRPFNTYLEIMANGDVNQTHIFNYDRFNILQFVENPVFNATVEVNTSAELITLLGTKLDLNFLPDDFWTSASTIEYCGGRVTPNWYMEACANSVYWTGRYVLWLHPSIPDPKPEPEPEFDWVLLDADTLGSKRYSGNLFSYQNTIFSVFGMGINYDGEPCPVMKYDIPTKTWTQLPDSPAPMRYSSSMAVVGNKAYFISGERFTDVPLPPQHDVWEWNLDTLVWTQLEDYPEDVTSGIATTVIGTKLYVMGGLRSQYINYGKPNTSRVRCLETTTNTWTELADLPNAYGEGAAFTLANKDVIYYVGGTMHVDGATDTLRLYSHVDKVLRYTISTNRWSVYATLPKKLTRYNYTMANDRLYLYKGLDLGTMGYSNVLYSYDGVTLAEIVTEGPSPEAMAAAAMTSNENVLYVSDGISIVDDAVALATDFWKYSPKAGPLPPPLPVTPVVTNTWRLINNDIPTLLRQQHCMFQKGSMFYCAFGSYIPNEDATEYVPRQFLRYDAVADTWDTLAQPPEGMGILLYNCAVAVYGEYAFFFGGSAIEKNLNTGDLEVKIKREVYRWKIDTDEWLYASYRPEALTGIGAVTIGDKIYLIGGAGGDGAVHSEPDSSKLTVLDTYTYVYSDLAELPMPLGRGTAFTLNDPDYIYYTFGLGRMESIWDDQTKVYGNANKVFKYRISTNTWTSNVVWPTPLIMPASTVLDGYLYVWGGLSDNNTKSNKMYRYDGVTCEEVPVNGTIPEAYAGSRMCSAFNTLYLTGGAAVSTDGAGRNGITESTQFWKFTPGT